MIVPAQIPNPYVKPKWQASVGIMESVVAYNCRKYGFPRPVGAWPTWEGAGNRALDLSGYGNNGTLVGQPEWVADGLDFNGSSDYIGCGNDPTLDVTTGSISIVAHLKASYSSTETVFSKTNDLANPSSPGYSLYLRTGDPYVRMTAQDGSNYAHQASSPTDIRDGKIHSIVGMWNGSTKSVSSYVDGSLEGTTQNNSVGSLTNTRPFEVGRDYNNGSPQYYFSDNIYTLFVFTTVLSTSQVKFLSDNPYFMYRLPEELYGYSPAVIGAIMNQFQKANMGADLYNGGIIA